MTEGIKFTEVIVNNINDLLLEDLGNKINQLNQEILYIINHTIYLIEEQKRVVENTEKLQLYDRYNDKFIEIFNIVKDDETKKIPKENLRFITKMPKPKFNRLLTKLNLDDRTTFTEHEYIYFINELLDKEKTEILNMTNLGISDEDLRDILPEPEDKRNLWKIRLQHITSLKERSFNKNIITKLKAAQQDLSSSSSSSSSSGFGKKVAQAHFTYMMPTIKSKYIIFIILIIGIITSCLICKK